MRVFLPLLLLVSLFPACMRNPAGLSQYRSVDLSYPFSKETLYWPTEDPFHLEKEAAGFTEKGYYYSSNHYAASEHGGTHMDAPIHFAEGRSTVTDLPLSQLQGPAYVVDLSSAVKTNPDYLITHQDLLAWEMKHGQIPPGAVLLLKTGYGRHWPDARKYLGTSERGPEAVKQLHFPGLDPSGAQWLVDHRRPNMVGIDTASIDYGQSNQFLTHQILAKAGIPILENVANLDQVPLSGFWVMALPMKIAGGSGAPTRIVALLPPETKGP